VTIRGFFGWTFLAIGIFTAAWLIFGAFVYFMFGPPGAGLDTSDGDVSELSPILPLSVLNDS
jgi:hypothetical protein